MLKSVRPALIFGTRVDINVLELLNPSSAFLRLDFPPTKVNANKPTSIFDLIAHMLPLVSYYLVFFFFFMPWWLNDTQNGKFGKICMILKY